MPICRSTLNAFSRTRGPSNSSPSTSFAPFLYQTATIQQRNHISRPIARRNLSTRPTRNIDIPFEDEGSLPPPVDSVTSSRKTTITAPERAAFKKLYNKFSNAENSQDEIPFSHEVDQIADEWYEEDEEDSSTPETLDSLFDAVLTGSPAPGQASMPKSKNQVKSLQTLAEELLKPEVDAAKKKSKQEARAEAARIKSIRDAERVRVEKILDSAQTDRELWEILNREVFDAIRKLDLDGVKKRSAKPDSLADPRIFFPNFPSHIVYATRLFRTDFPSSPLPLSVLPTLKSLGRSPYALGATTSLYNLVIRTAWSQHLSYDYLDELLTDMDNGGIAFDLGTLGIINSIVIEYADARKGRLGRPIEHIWKTEQVRESSQKMFRWREAVMQRLRAWTEKRAKEGRVIRKFDFDQRNPAAERGPDDDIGFELGVRRKTKAYEWKMPKQKATPKGKADPAVSSSNTSESQEVKQGKKKSASGREAPIWRSVELESLANEGGETATDKQASNVDTAQSTEPGTQHQQSELKEKKEVVV